MSAPPLTIRAWRSLPLARTSTASASTTGTTRRTSLCWASGSERSPRHRRRSAPARRALLRRSGSRLSTSQPSQRRLRPIWSLPALQRAAERSSHALRGSGAGDPSRSLTPRSARSPRTRQALRRGSAPPPGVRRAPGRGRAGRPVRPPRGFACQSSRGSDGGGRAEVLGNVVGSFREPLSTSIGTERSR